MTDKPDPRFGSRANRRVLVPFRQNAWRAAMMAMLVSIPACNDSPTHPVGCSGSVTINVRPSLDPSGTPQFDWSPRCGITNLTVIVLPVGIGDPAVMWDISAPENSQIAPPVTYGHVPRGATGGFGPEPLQAGSTYRVSILSIVGGDVIDAQAEKTFVR